jgi:predicted transcriptional regulator
MGKALPELSRLELQCLRFLGVRGEGLIREVRADLPQAPSYSTVRKIFERLEEKGAIRRVRRQGRAWVYRSCVSSSAMIRREVRRLVDRLFDGQGAPLVAQLADMEAITLDDLREIEARLDAGLGAPARSDAERSLPGARRRRLRGRS